MAAGDDINRIRERYQLEEQINKAIKEGTQNFSEYVDMQKKIVENYKLMRELQKKITDLQALGTQEAQDEVKILQSQLDQLVKINKELSKSSVLAKAVGGQLKEWGKTIAGQFLPSLGDVYSSFLKIDALAHQTANTLGFQGSKLGLMRDNISFTRDEFINLGYDIEDAYKAQTALSEATGRQVMLTREASTAMAETARITGMEVDQLAGMTGEMEAFGLGAKQSADFVLKMSKESSAMGLNSGKVIKSFQQNLGLLNKLNFKNGVKGLKDMAIFSEKFKIDMQDVAAVADKVFRPEGAIEAAAQLQVLGGSLATLGDPFQLMYKARNSPEELAKSLTKAAKASAVFNEKTGEFEVNAYELDRLKEAAQALGMDYSKLVETAKQGAKIQKFEGLLGGKGLDKETMEALSGAAQMGEKGAFVTIKGEPKLLKDLSAAEAKLFIDQKSSQQDLAKQAMSLQNNLDSIKNEIMITFVKFFEQNEPMIKSFLETVKSFVSGVLNVVKGISDILGPKGTLFTGLTLYFGAKAGWAYIQGLIFGRAASTSFNAGTIGKSAIGAASGGASAVGGVTGASSMGAAAGGGAGGGPGQITNGLNPMNMIKGAAAILILSGALFVFGKALQEFDKLKNGWESLAIAAVSLVVFSAAVFGLGALLDTGVGAAIFASGVVGFMALGVALGVFGLGLSQVIEPIGLFIDKISKLGALSDALPLVGKSLLLLGGGLMALSASLVTLSIGWALGGSAFMGLTSSLTSVGKIDSTSIDKTIEAINKIDTNKLEALKDLSMWMALLGGTTTIKFDENLKVDGSIQLTGAAGGKTNTDWINDPIFVSKLKEMIETSKTADRKGGKA